MEIISYIVSMLQQNKKCSVPGIGTWEMQYQPAVEDMSEAKIHPPAYVTSFFYQPDVNGESFVSYVAEQQNILPLIANLQVEKSVAAIKRLLDDGETITIPQLGQLTKNITGEVEFKNTTSLNNGWQPVEAPVIIHQSVINTPPKEIVTEDESTAEENVPGEVLLPVISAPEKNYRWLVWAAIIIVIAGAGVWLAVHYHIFSTHLKSNTSLKADSSVQAIQNNPSSSDTTQHNNITPVSPLPAAPDSLHYTVVFSAYTDKNRAYHQYHKMKDWGLNIVEIKDKDSLHIYLGIPFISTPQDTTLHLEEVRKTYGGKPFIIYLYYPLPPILNKRNNNSRAALSGLV